VVASSYTTTNRVQILTMHMRPPTVTLIRNMFDRQLSHVAELLDDMGSDSEMEIGSMPLRRKHQMYVCFEKAQTASERAAWT